jgi:O-antigen ligase
MLQIRIVKILIVIFIVFAGVLGQVLGIQSAIIRLTIVPLIITVMVTRLHLEIIYKKEFIAYVLILFFSFISVLTPMVVDMELYKEELYNISLVLFLFILFYNLVMDFPVFKIIIVSYLIVSVVLVIFVFVQSDVFFAIHFQRFEEVFDSNSYGYYFFLAVFGLGYFRLNNDSKALRFFYYILLGAFILAGMVNASRGTVVILILSHLVVEFIVAKRTFYYQLAGGILFLIVYGGGFLEDYLVYKRFQIVVELGTTPRLILIQIATELFLEHPFFGVGAGNFLMHEPTRHFTHSTYFEIASGTGMFGLASVLYFTIYPFFRIYNLRDKEILSKKESLLWFGFFAVFAIYSFLYTFYSATYIILFLFVVLSYFYKLEAKYNQR